MAKLGDFFPENWKEQLAKENIKPGAVIRVHVPDTTPPKYKWLIITGMEDGNISLATIFINTEINPNVFNTTYLVSLQLTLSKQKNPFLDHDSFADCSTLTERSFNGILNIVKQQPGCHMGQLHDDDLSLVHDTIKKARTISPVQKKKFGFI